MARLIVFCIAWSLVPVAMSARPSLLGARDVLSPRDWQPNQQNQTLCWWEQPRSAIIRDTLYIDGGYMGYLPGFANGSVGAPIQPEDGQFLYALNFTTPFTTSQNASDVLQTINKTSGAANNLAPNFYDGTLFANDDEFYEYGGLLRDTDSLDPPPATSVLGFERFQYGPQRDSWQPGFYDGQLPDGITRYVTAGASVNVPSQNLAFYFSGMRGPTWGDIRAQGRSQYNATVVANTMISIDMSVMRSEKYTNTTLPSTIPGRANAELVWIPVSDLGVLVALGGVIEPSWAFLPLTDAQKVQSQNVSPGFMETVSVYDIKSATWYNQATSGDIPPQLTQFCSVVASAKDGSSQNIYIYGGWDGLDDTSAPSDDVYVLSLPSFTWVHVYNGTSAHGRRSHKCAKVYPDQMFVVGGQTQQAETFSCLADGVIQIFNLNTLAWQDSYDPKVWSQYKVPSVITAQIGGSGDGGAQSTKPSSWSNNSLAGLFGTKYSAPITTYYPYASIAASPTGGAVPTRLSTTLPTPVPQSSGTPTWVGPVVGVLVALIVLAALLTCFVLYRRRGGLRRRGTVSDTGTSRGNRIMNWIPYPPKAATASTTGDHSDDSGATAIASSGNEKHGVHEHYMPAEVSGSPLHELPANTPPTELPDGSTGQEFFGFSSSSPSRSVGSPITPISGIPRPESPTASPTSPLHDRHASDISSMQPVSPTNGAFTRGHTRQVSSLDSAGMPSLGSGVSEAGLEDARRSSRHRSDLQSHRLSDLSPVHGEVTPPEPEAPPPAPGQPHILLSPPAPTSPTSPSRSPASGRQSSFGEVFR
ncbi:MAG: hypothetical protein M1838_004505 [Thelocarpon superellum]|nr:MAG: hypothetical protein M1838_004505 [Thelocarpon superellum]